MKFRVGDKVRTTLQSFGIAQFTKGVVVESGRESRFPYAVLFDGQSAVIPVYSSEIELQPEEVTTTFKVGDKVRIVKNQPGIGEEFAITGLLSNHLGTYATGDSRHNGIYLKNLELARVKTSDLKGGEHVRFTVEGSVEVGSDPSKPFVRVSPTNGFWIHEIDEVELLKKLLPTTVGSVVKHLGKNSTYLLTHSGWVSVYGYGKYTSREMTPGWELVYEA